MSPVRGAESAGGAVFSWASYVGSDPEESVFPATSAEYRNPIVPGFQPDPSIIRVQDGYYLTNSTFAFFPGLPIYHSRDLVNWRQVGNAVDRPGQFDFSGLGVARGMFAPTLRWRDGVFYLIGTCEDCGGSFILHATQASGPWSDPVWLTLPDAIDPDLFFDSDGRAWIAYNGPPDGPPAYTGHRAIWLQEFDLSTLRLVGGRSVIVNGGVDFARQPIWIEGPHLIKRGQSYFLIAAEGGTEGNHSEVVFRSDRVGGPYLPGPVNPILTQRDLDADREFPITATGHADFVQAGDGRWWSVFLGSRPYRANLSNMGRETFLLPVNWDGEWPQILPPKRPVPHIVERPRLPSDQAVDRAHWRDSFVSNQLAPDWEMINTPVGGWFQSGSGRLVLEARAVSISSDRNPSFLGKRQRHANVVFETAMRYRPTRSGDCAGLVTFADERHHYFLGLCATPSGPRVLVKRRDGAADPEEGHIIGTAAAGREGDSIRLRISARGAVLDFSYAVGDAPWKTLLAGADGSILASEPTNRFTGALFGVYAVRAR